MVYGMQLTVKIIGTVEVKFHTFLFSDHLVVNKAVILPILATETTVKMHQQLSFTIFSFFLIKMKIQHIYTHTHIYICIQLVSGIVSMVAKVEKPISHAVCNMYF
jgi:hypothetical protein